MSGVRRALVAMAIVGSSWLAAPPASADMVRGVTEILTGVFAVPYSAVVGTFSGPPVIGTALGALRGTVTGIGLVAHGALELANSAIGLGMKAAPFVLPFLF